MTKKSGVGRGNNPASWGNHKSGPDHPRWNDDRHLTHEGHVKVRVGKDHPLADPNGYAYEHLLIWVAAGRPRPGPGELLHHANEVKTDNRLSNLELLTRAAHAREHHNMLSDENVRAIRERYAAGEDGTALAAEFGVPFQRVYRFIHGDTRRSAGGAIVESGLRKKAAGRLLDGRTHDGFPEAAR
jgi:hypothetical protein